MNNPKILQNISTNQWRNNILGYTNKLSDEKQQWIDAIKDRFQDNNLDYYPVNKNFDTLTIYDALIYEGSEKDKLLGNKKFLSYPYDTSQFIVGDYIDFQYGDDNETWILTSLDKAQIWNVTGDIERCVSNLKWIDENGTLQSWPCAIKDLTNRTMPDTNSLITTLKGFITVKVQANDDTNKIIKNMRFLLGIENNYTAFRTVFINNFSKTNLIVIDLEAVSIAPEDDVINGVAKNNYSELVNPINSGTSYIITSSDNSIIQDSTNTKLYYSTLLLGTDNIQTYNVYSYSDGTQQSDTFTISVDNTCGVPSGYYTFSSVDGNTFKIQNNKMYLNNKLKVICADNVNGDVVELDVQLGGEFG